MALAKVLLFSISAVSALEWDDGTGKLPALGWNSWNAYHCDINESLILDAAKAMVDFGFKVCPENSTYATKLLTHHVRMPVINMSISTTAGR